MIYLIYIFIYIYISILLLIFFLKRPFRLKKVPMQRCQRRSLETLNLLPLLPWKYRQLSLSQKNSSKMPNRIMKWILLRPPKAMCVWSPPKFQRIDVPEPMDVENVDQLAILDRKDSVASTVSLGDCWEKEYYEYKEENGQWVKYVKEKYMPLARARNWKLGPIPAGEEVAVPVCKGLGTVTVPVDPASSQPLQPAAPTASPAQPLAFPAPMATPAVPLPETPAATAARPLPETVPAMTQALPETPSSAPMASPAQPSPETVEAPAQPLPKALVPVATPPDRTLELAGLQALMEGQKAREHAAAMEEVNKFEAQRLLDAQGQQVAMPGVERIDWTTHKKEGMRLKRLIEESADGAQTFPYMAKMWAGSKEDYMGV